MSDSRPLSAPVWLPSPTAAGDDAKKLHVPISEYFRSIGCWQDFANQQTFGAPNFLGAFLQTSAPPIGGAFFVTGTRSLSPLGLCDARESPRHYAVLKTGVGGRVWPRCARMTATALGVVAAASLWEEPGLKPFSAGFDTSAPGAFVAEPLPLRRSPCSPEGRPRLSWHLPEHFFRFPPGCTFAIVERLRSKRDFYLRSSTDACARLVCRNHSSIGVQGEGSLREEGKNALVESREVG